MTIELPQANVAGRTAADGRTKPEVPRLIDGVRLLGEYEGSGYQEPRYLVGRADEQTLLMPRVPYLVLRHVNGARDLRQVSELVSAEQGQRIGPDGVRYLIETKLAPLGLVTLDDVPVQPPTANPLLALNVRATFIPAHVVRVVARLLAPLHLPAFVAALLAGLVALDCWMFASGQADGALQQTMTDPLSLLAMLLLCLASLVFHEFGHASACHYGGARPGAIGAGLYVMLPCFYTNVTDAYRLNRAGRLRTDLGGIYFNAIFIVALGCAYLTTGYPPFLAAAVLGHLEIVQQLPPVVRLDGYYIMADLVGVPNLFGRVRPILRSLLRRGRYRRLDIDLRPSVRRIVTAWVLVVVPLLVLALGVMLVRLPDYAGSAWSSAMHYGDMAARAFLDRQFGVTVLGLLSMLLIALPWVGMGALLAQSLRRVGFLLLRRVLAARAGTGGKPPAGAGSAGGLTASG